VLLEVMYKLPSETEVNKVVIDKNVINGASEPLLIYENIDQQKVAPE
jgi:ATP-dependent Clp protease ATP-binding subunit ClpX